MNFSHLAIFITFALTGSFAVEWSDAGIKVSTKEQAHFTDAKLYEIMSTGSEVYISCQSGRGEYPTGGTMGKAFCLFDKLGYFADDEKMKINWDEIHNQFAEHSHMVDECKDSDYDTDGGFWDGVGDWWSGEDFDYSTVDTAAGNFYNCCAKKAAQEARDLFNVKFGAQCPV